MVSGCDWSCTRTEMRPSKPILPLCLHVFAVLKSLPFSDQTFFPEPGTMYLVVSCGPNWLQWPRRE